MEGAIVPADDGLSYFESLPRGYRFSPTDFELIHHFLRNKILNPHSSFKEIHEINVYNFNPERLTAIYGLNRANEWYFFSPRSRKYVNGDRPNRSAGDGYWKATAKDKKIYYYCGQKVEGRKRTLVFYQGNPNPRGTSIKTNWIMQEYVLPDSYLPRQNMHNNGDGIMLLNQYVLCKIYKKRGNKNSNPTQENMNQPADQRLEYDHRFNNGVVNAHENNNNYNNIPAPLPSGSSSNYAQLDPSPRCACAFCNPLSYLNCCSNASINDQNQELTAVLYEQINGGDDQRNYSNNNYNNMPDQLFAMNDQNQDLMVVEVNCGVDDMKNFSNNDNNNNVSDQLAAMNNQVQELVVEPNGGADQLSFSTSDIFEDLPDLTFSDFEQRHQLMMPEEEASLINAEYLNQNCDELGHLLGSQK